MDFITSLPKGKRGNDAIWVVIDRLTKSALFLPIKMIDPVDKLAQLYVNEVIRLHGISVSIVFYQEIHFTTMVEHSICLRNAVGIKYRFSSSNERTI
jgi:hypothetical protein